MVSAAPERDEGASSVINPIGIQSEILPLLRQVFGSQTQLAEMEIGNQNTDYLVLLLTLSHPFQKVVLKLAGPAAPIACPFDRTAVFYRLVAGQTGIPMPEVFRC